MEDYIDVLLEYLSGQRLSFLGHEYVLCQEQETLASQALFRTFTEEQQKLFLAYEDARNACASVSEDAFARQAFLLAREIYR